MYDSGENKHTAALRGSLKAATANWQKQTDDSREKYPGLCLNIPIH